MQRQLFCQNIPKPSRTNLAIYADDTAILARSKTPHLVTSCLQEAVEALEEGCKRWLITVNPEKSTALLISERRTGPVGNVTMFNWVIPWRSQANYLGVIIDKRLTFIPHIEYVVAKMNGIKGSLSALIGRRSKMSIRNKLLLYRTIMRPP